MCAAAKQCHLCTDYVFTYRICIYVPKADFFEGVPHSGSKGRFIVGAVQVV
jgi:hypothetical protein